MQVLQVEGCIIIRQCGEQEKSEKYNKGIDSRQEPSLKELRNCTRKLFLCPPQKYAKTQPAFLTAIHGKFTLRHIKLCTCRKTNLIFIKIFIWSSLFWKSKENSHRPKYTLSFLTLSEKKRLKTLKSKATGKNYFSGA